MPLLDFSSADYSLSIGGRDMKLTGLSIRLGFNVPPMVHGSAVPADLVDKKLVAMTDADVFWDAYKQVDNAVGKESVDLKIRSLGPDEESNFDAKGWILGSADIAVAADSQTGGGRISFNALHPICNLQRYPANVGPVSPSPSYGDVEGETFLDVLGSAIDAYLKNTSSATQEQIGYRLMQEGRSKLSEYLKCDANLDKLADMFSGISDAESVKDGFRKYILSCIESGGENSSMWDLVAGSLAASLSLRLYMDKNDLSAKQLRLSPGIPYTRDRFRVFTKDIASIYNSSGSWLKCTGLSAWAPVSSGFPWNAEHEYDSDPFVPDVYCSVAAKENMLQMCNVNLPGWFEAILAHCTPASFNSPHEAEDFVDFEDMADAIRDKACRRLLTQQFLDLYRQTTDITVTKVFSFKDSAKSGLVLPGMSCGIADEKAVRLVFNVSEVEHEFDLNSNLASTTIRGNYVRGNDFSVSVEGAEDVDLITNGFSADKNYIWS